MQADDLVLIINKLEKYEEKITAMTILYVDMRFGEFKSPDELRKAFQKGLTEIWHPSEGGSDAAGL